jgi:hypothetical protein
MKTSILFAFLLFSIGNSCLAQKYTNDKYQFSINIPVKKGWDVPQVMTQEDGKLKKPLELLIVVTNAKSQNKISVQVIDVDDDITMSSIQHREGFTSGLIKHGGIRVASENVTTLATVPCYQLTLVGLLQGNPINMRMMALNANGYQYNLTSYSSDTTHLIDSSLEKILTSFKFNSPPKIPKSK